MLVLNVINVVGLRLTWEAIIIVLHNNTKVAAAHRDRLSSFYSDIS